MNDLYQEMTEELNRLYKQYDKSKITIDSVLFMRLYHLTCYMQQIKGITDQWRGE